MDRFVTAIAGYAACIAFLLATVDARGQFATVVNAPPATISPDTIFGSDTQVNLWYDSQVAGLLFLGGESMPVVNTELNIRGGRVNAVQAWFGSRLNVSEGSIRTANLIGAEGRMSGGTVRTWSLYTQSRLYFSGGEAAHVETGGSNTGDDPDSSLLIVAGGQIGALDATGNVVISGGAVGDGFVFRGGGYADISGGIVGNDFQVGAVVIGAIPDSNEPVVAGSGGQVRVRGGAIGDRMVLYGGRELTFSGGSVGQAFYAMEGSHVHILGSHFLVDGVALERPSAANTIMLTQRNITLSGILASGRDFQFDLNDQLGQPGRGDYFSPMATISVTFVPEPRSGVSAILLILTSLLTVRRRSVGGKAAGFRDP